MNGKRTDAIIAKLETLKIRHRYCEDSWYSCPKAVDGCIDESQGDECNCQAEAHNIAINEIIEMLMQD